MDLIGEELGVPRKYLKNTIRDERFAAVVHKTWLKSLIKYGQLIKFIEKGNFEVWPGSNDDLEPSFTKVYITVIKKVNKKVIPLPRIRSFKNNCNSKNLSLSQLLQYIMTTNHKNLWKDSYKKYSEKYSEEKNVNKSESNITLAEYNSVVREVIIRIYGCPWINLGDANLTSQNNSKYFECHQNILNGVCAIEGRNAIFLINLPFIENSLQECVSFSPAILESSNAKPLFLIYQLLQSFLNIHDRGLILGDVTLNDIFLTENLWLQIIPNLTSNLHIQESLIFNNKNLPSQTLNLDCRISGHVTDSSNRCQNCGRKFYDRVHLRGDESLSTLCELWLQNQISNFTYLTCLNNLAGRKMNEPNNHHVFPWVTDFSSRCGNNWRDLTKSKFRLNKGDRQLDLTFEHSQNQVPHHVSDVLSSITYYVYMARRTPKSVLCKNVRTIWVPAEYPSSIQRLQEWTPDECIPEFFSDPLVFKSIHEDLSDLETPPWSSSPEDFVEKHREALESSYASERLHHWIDLTFGYKLSGVAAIKSKNVCLQLVDDHKNLTSSGIVQLFTHPHPAKICQSPFTGKTPPKIHTVTQKSRSARTSTPQPHETTTASENNDDNDESSGPEDQNSDLSTNLTPNSNSKNQSTSQSQSPLVLSRLLSRSKSSLNSNEEKSQSQNSDQNANSNNQTLNIPTVKRNQSQNQYQKTSSNNLTPKYPTFTSHISQSGKIPNQNQNISVQRTNYSSNENDGRIFLPKGFNPVSQLTSCENYHDFLSKTFFIQRFPSESNAHFEQHLEETTDDTSFTNKIFNDNYEAKFGSTSTKNAFIQKKQSTSNYKKIISDARQRELKILGCLIVEIFMNKYLRVEGNPMKMDFETRLRSAVGVLKFGEVPKIIKNATSLLFDIDLENWGTLGSQRTPLGSRGTQVSEKVLLGSGSIGTQVIPSGYQRTSIGAISGLGSRGTIGSQGVLLNLGSQGISVGSLGTISGSGSHGGLLGFQGTHSGSSTQGITLGSESPVTNSGLPPPSAHQLLQPLIKIFPFPQNFNKIYNFLVLLMEFTNLSRELQILYHFDCNGENCSKFENLERTKILFQQSIGECKVKYCAKNLESLMANDSGFETVNLLLPFVKELLEDASTSILAAWYLLDPITKVLGPKKSTENLLSSILSLYENETENVNFIFNSKIAKLYHHSFLLRLIVRFGLKVFLENFITPLVEAVGGYKDFDRSDIIFHNHSQKTIRKISNLKSIDDSSVELENLSPLDEESSETADSEKILISPSTDEISNSKENQNEPEMFEFENEELKNAELVDQLEFNISNKDLNFDHSGAEEATEEILDEVRDLENTGLKSPTIPIPSSCRQSELITIGCDVGSKKNDETSSSDRRSELDYDSTNDSKINRESTRSSSSVFNESNSSSVDSRRTRRNNKISDMSADSLIWLSHRLGPVLTARYLSRNLLRMLTLCYVGRENLERTSSKEDGDFLSDVDSVSIVNWRVTGDRNASKVLFCLVSTAALYGEQLILLQYLPHMSELIALSKRKLTANSEGALISCLVLLKHIVPYLVDATLMDQLQDVILKNILHPAVRLLGSSKYIFPNGPLARNVLARKYLDAVYVLSLRIGADMTRTHLVVPGLQRFFLIFNKVYDDVDYYNETYNASKQSPTVESPKCMDHYVEVRRDGTVAEWAVKSGSRPFQFSQLRIKDTDSADSFSPPTSMNFKSNNEPVNNRSLDELRDIFTCELAHTAFLPFLHYIGDTCMQVSLKNHSLIRDLCFEYERKHQLTPTATFEPKFTSSSAVLTLTSSSVIDVNEEVPVCVGSTGSFGTNVALVGNRIDVRFEQEESRQSSVLNLVSNKMENTNRHLRGNWLAYWEHEIGRADKDTMFNFKQIKLQYFNGHTNTVKAIQILDNENSFMSASKDKTVKLWSLRSQGDGSSVSHCQSTYTGHKKSVLSVTFLESLRLTASCDSVVHLWDPFMGSLVSQLEGPRAVPVSMVKSMPAPSPILLAATDNTVRLIDARLCSFVQELKNHELKVSLNPLGFIRCLTVSPSGNYLAVGHSSGNIVVLDGRTGLVISAWKAHDGEILQLASIGENTLVSSGLDQAVSVWNVNEGKLKFNMKGATEPIHCLTVYNSELISGSTANRIGVHTSVDVDASFSSTRLRSDTFKGVLTSMAILPLNRLLLLGADSGNISLLC